MRRGIAISLLTLAGIGLAALGYEADLSSIDGGADLAGIPPVQGVKLEPGFPAGMELIELDGEPSYARLPIGGRSFTLLLDRSGDGARLYVDREGDGDLRPVDWEAILPDGTLVSRVDLLIDYDGTISPYRAVLMWNGLIPTVLTYYSDSYRLGVIPLPKRDVKVALVDQNSDGFYDDPDRDFLLVDVDGDGELLAAPDSHERFAPDEPFNIDGTGYVVASISPDGSRTLVEESEDPVEPKPPLLPGYPAPDFSALDSDGNPISLSDLRGRIVVLDFWAGWCTPCVEELDMLALLAEELAEVGGVLIGIDLDRSLNAFRAAVAEHGIDYRQVYDGPDGPIGEIYRIGGIPMIYLIDEDGIIRDRDLRGDDSIDAVDRLIAEEDAG